MAKNITFEAFIKKNWKRKTWEPHAPKTPQQFTTIYDQEHSQQAGGQDVNKIVCLIVHSWWQSRSVCRCLRSTISRWWKDTFLSACSWAASSASQCLPFQLPWLLPFCSLAFPKLGEQAHGASHGALCDGVGRHPGWLCRHTLGDDGNQEQPKPQEQQARASRTMALIMRKARVTNHLLNGMILQVPMLSRQQLCRLIRDIKSRRFGDDSNSRNLTRVSMEVIVST